MAVNWYVGPATEQPKPAEASETVMVLVEVSVTLAVLPRTPSITASPSVLLDGATFTTT